MERDVFNTWELIDANGNLCDREKIIALTKKCFEDANDQKSGQVLLGCIFLELQRTKRLRVRPILINAMGLPGDKK